MQKLLELSNELETFFKFGKFGSLLQIVGESVYNSPADD